jgi:hypothetical protein
LVILVGDRAGSERYRARQLRPAGAGLRRAEGAGRRSASTKGGKSKFTPYADIESVKQLKVVWDFNFVDPNTVDIA